MVVKTNMQEVYSNTTNVKVKHSDVHRNVKPGEYSNTTNVKVKRIINLLALQDLKNSNTTNVKVKPQEGDKNTIPENKFKYNQC